MLGIFRREATSPPNFAAKRMTPTCKTRNIIFVVSDISVAGTGAVAAPGPSAVAAAHAGMAAATTKPAAKILKAGLIMAFSQEKGYFAPLRLGMQTVF